MCRGLETNCNKRVDVPDWASSMASSSSSSYNICSSDPCRPLMSSCKPSVPHVTREENSESDAEKEQTTKVNWDAYFLSEKSDQALSTRHRVSHGANYESYCCMSDMAAAALLGSCCATTGSGYSARRPSSRRKHRTYDEHLASANEEEFRIHGSATSPFGRWLKARNLESYEGPLAQLGVHRVADLVYLTDEDMDRLNVDQEARMQFYVRVTEHPH